MINTIYHHYFHIFFLITGIALFCFKDAFCEESTLPFTFSAGTPISSSQVNENFQFLLDKINAMSASNSLAAYYSFDNHVMDDSGNGRNCVIRGSLAYEDGVKGKAISFIGNNSDVMCGLWFNYQRFTISFWVKPGNTQQTYADIIDLNHRDNINFVLQQDKSITNNYNFGMSIVGKNGGEIINIVLNTDWQHLVLVKDLTTGYHAYLNGVKFYSSSSFSTSKTINYDGGGYLTFGDHYSYNNRGWRGLLDDVKIYSRVLTSEEIQKLYNDGAP